MIDSSAVVERHYCPMPPRILAFNERDPGPIGAPNIVMLYPEGTRFVCDGCGSVKVVAWVESGYINVSDSWQWIDEPRKQRRARLGLRWWQRG